MLQTPKFARATLFLSAFLLAPLQTEAAPATDAWKTPLNGEQKIAHALNRLSFGPRPGDVETVRKIGVEKWVESQLSPEKLSDEGLEAKLAQLSLLRESQARLRLAYQGDRGQIRRFLQAKNGLQTKEQKPIELNPRDQKVLKEFQASGLSPGTSVQATGELVTDKLARAIASKRQFKEVLTDFWGNHFNVDARKGPVGVFKVTDDRETIRPHGFGSFRALLGASAQSPAMLFYLDNARSTVARPMRRTGAKARGGLNENYARELMELHTLGVDGGYSQQDVTEVARCFTGWGIGNDGEFEFHGRLHDNGTKTVLGQKIAPNGGKRDGARVLDILASHPSTANFLARKLCLRFVSDEPPISLQNRVAAAFLTSKGDLTTTYRALFEAPEFWSRGAYRSKIKSPFEFAVSAVRALDGNLEIPDPQMPRGRFQLLAVGRISTNPGKAAQKQSRTPLAGEISQMGQPLFACQPPTGWSEISTHWVSTGAIVSRLNFALALANGRVADVQMTTDTLRPTPLDALARQIVGDELTPATRATIEKEIQTAPGDGAKMRALILGSPEFQRR